MADEKKELALPPGHEEEESLEILRCWVRGSDKSLVVVFRTATWEAIEVWGILLADITRHLGNALEDEQGFKSEEVISRIADMYSKEMGKPTSEAELLDDKGNRITKGN